MPHEITRCGKYNNAQTFSTLKSVSVSSGGKRIAISQPTYLPRIGYFDLVDQVNTFVFLDTVQFEKQSWQQRSRIKTPTGLQWLTGLSRFADGPFKKSSKLKSIVPFSGESTAICCRRIMQSRHISIVTSASLHFSQAAC